VADVISISAPPGLREALDAAAARQRRSRSYVVVEAIRAYLAAQEQDAFAAARLRTLRDGLAKTPAERVAVSESLWREFARGRPVGKPWLAGFDTHEAHQRWRRNGGAVAT
jgi:predicted transcriptional regulator